MNDDPRAGGWRRAAIGVLVGASAWLSAGTLAVIDASALTRLGAVPDLRWLLAAVAAGVAAAVFSPLPASGFVPLSLLALLWLPWLPLPVPAVFLLWEGPLEAAVWTIAIGGLLWAGLPRPRPGLIRWLAPPRAPVIAALLAVLVFAAAWTIARPRVPAGDEPHYLVIAQSLLYDHDLRIENNHQQDQYLAYYDGVLKPDFMRRGVDRQIYSIHAPGVAALVLPAFAAVGYPGAVGTVIVAIAAGTAAAWLAAWWLTASIGAAWAAWLALVVSAPLVLHGYAVYPDPVGAAAVMSGVLALVTLETGAPALGPRAWVLVGAAVALLPWLHTRFALLAAGLGLAIVLRLRRRADARRALAAFAAVPLVAAAGWFGYFWRIYGTPNPAAPYGARPEGGLEFIPAGLTGLLSDQQFGLVATAPVLLAAVAGMLPLARHRPRLAIEVAAIVLPYLLVVSTYPMWWGGYSAPGRFAVVVLLPAALPLAALWAAGRFGRGVIVALTVVSAAITAALVTHDRGAFIYNGRDGHALLLDWLSPTVDLTLGTPSVHRDGALAAAGDAAIWLAAAAVVAGLWVLLARRRPHGVETAVAGVLAVPVAVMTALPVVWAGRDRPVITPPTSQMAFIGRWHPAARPLGVALTPTRRLELPALLRRISLDTSVRGYRPPGASPLLQIPLVPAGDYDVVADGRSRLAGTATVRLGRHDLPLAVWPLEGRSAGVTGLVLSLPARAHSIAIDGDDAARATVRRLSLRPRTLPPSATGVAQALRAARLGSVTLFALDDNAFLEPGAAWIRGERTARFIVQPDGAAAVMRLQGGAVANTITLAASGWRMEVALPANDIRNLPLPADALAPAVLSVTSATGFRPSEHTPGSDDLRWLGVYVRWP